MQLCIHAQDDEFKVAEFGHGEGRGVVGGLGVDAEGGGGAFGDGDAFFDGRHEVIQGDVARAGADCEDAVGVGHGCTGGDQFCVGFQSLGQDFFGGGK